MYVGITPIFHFNKFAFRRSVKYPFHTVRTLPLRKPLGFHEYFTDRLNVAIFCVHLKVGFRKVTTMRVTVDGYTV